MLSLYRIIFSVTSITGISVLSIIFFIFNRCPNETNAFGLTNGFRYAGIDSSTSVNKRLFRTETDSFVMISDYPPNNFYYFSCYVGYCFGSLGTDSRCIDVSPELFLIQQNFRLVQFESISR